MRKRIADMAQDDGVRADDVLPTTTARSHILVKMTIKLLMVTAAGCDGVRK